jgi:divalent metal cation (Fe/Co/Zn/Cd) transporter
MINILRNAGVSEGAITLVVIIMAIFFALVGLALVGLGVYAFAVDKTVPPWATAGIFSIVSFMGYLLASHQTTQQIDGSSARGAATAINSLQPSMSQMVNLLAAAQPIEPQAPPVASSQVAETVQENTEATEHNTEVMKETEGEHHL